MGYHTSKPVESVVYCLNNTVKVKGFMRCSGWGGGGAYVHGLCIEKPVILHIELEEAMSLLVLHYGILCFSLVQFQPIFVRFVTISTVLCCCLKATVWLVRILP